jgi:dipeptidyl aminopeptidase/acylaminoacyl peptidase
VIKVRLPRIVAMILILPGMAGLAVAPAAAQDVILAKEAYLKPSKEITDAVLAARHENVTLGNLSPDGKRFLIVKSDGMPTLERMARPCVYLAEMAFDHVGHRARDLWIHSNAGLEIFDYAANRKMPVQIPDKARVGMAAWSPDGGRLAFFVHFEDATYLYIADASTGLSRKLTPIPVLATLSTTFQWTKDGARIQAVLRPDDGTRELPRPDAVAVEPKVRVARGNNNPSRIYRYLLESPYDMKLLEHLATGQLAMIDVQSGRVTRVGEPAMIRSVSMAPDGQEFRVTLLKKPFSYFVPASRFGSQESIWDRAGKNLVTLADKPLKEIDPQSPTPDPKNPPKKGKGAQAQQPKDPANLQPDGTPVDPDAKRALAWRPDGAGLGFLQQEPAVKDSKEPRKDRVLLWLPPFGKDDIKVVWETPHPITSAQYSEDGRMLFVTQTVENQRQILAVDMKDPKTTYVVYKAGAKSDGDSQDPESADDTEDGQQAEQPKKGGGFGGGFAGGANLMTRSIRGEGAVVRVSSAGEVYLSGTDRSGGAVVPRPYIDKIDIKTGKKTRIFEGRGDLLETIDAIDGDDVKFVFTTRQKEDVVPDSYVTDLQSRDSRKLTSNVDHTPWYHKLKVDRFQVTRVDGFKFWVKVSSLPQFNGKLPALFWIYPREYTDQDAYNKSVGRGVANTQRFNAPRPRSMTLLCLEGYAVVEPDVPIVGPAGRMNDNYIPDLRNSLWAVIDECDKRGLIDRDRLAIGGHSYGAFSTANALAHTPFFKAGIAGDGNYNRTLTSMTFQTEKRQLWEAREIYLEMSPLLWANRVNGALLMYHGMDDANVGTNPINAEHLFAALDGLGKPAALYMYPYEGHGPLARETNLDQWARWTAWLELYVKNPPKKM